jgi:aspartyl-tRNA(Asn)/glutamyl-tRNA(Gln) amidotransferase subunit A
MIFSVSKRPTISEIHTLYKDQKATVWEVSKFFLNRSEEVDPELNAVDNYTQELAQKQAEKLDKVQEEYKQKEGEGYFEKLLKDYPLFGIPYFTKAIILVEGVVANAGSKILDGFVAPYSATVSERLEKAGSVLLGVATMDEFATGSSGETSAYGPTKNPFDTTRTPGGSSSGPATVVASGQCVFSLGTDTGGSIRLPAAFTDTVGLKPTYGLVPRYGVIPMASSFDQVGPFSNCVGDNLLVTSILGGKDDYDQTSLDSFELIAKLNQVISKTHTSRKTKQINSTLKPLKIGLPEEFFIDGIDPIIRAAVENIKQKLESIGHKLVKVSLPLAKHALSVYYMTMPVELAANLERFDGVRYALQDQNPDSEMYYNQRQNFGKEVTRRILLGPYVSSAGYYDAYYNLAQKVRQLAKQDFDRVFEEVDLLLTPVTSEFPFKLGQKSSDPLSMYLTDAFTCGINPVRIPGISVPLGLFEVQTEEGKIKLPTGVQILGPELSEDKIFELALEVEKLVSEEK